MPPNRDRSTTTETRTNVADSTKRVASLRWTNVCLADPTTSLRDNSETTGSCEHSETTPRDSKDIPMANRSNEANRSLHHVMLWSRFSSAFVPRSLRCRRYERSDTLVPVPKDRPRQNWYSTRRNSPPRRARRRRIESPIVVDFVESTIPHPAAVLDKP